MTKIVLLIVVLFSSLQVYSQSISVDLSTHWRKGENPLSLNDSICIPYLDIAYCNNSDKALYFLKIAQKENEFPIITVSGSLMERKVPPDELIIYYDYSKEKFTIKLLSSPVYLGALEVVPDTIDIHEEHEISEINDELSDIYKYLSRKKNAQIDYTKWTYLSSDVTPEKILNEFRDNFIFLKPGEAYTDTYNLIAFKLVKGTFTFYVDPKLTTYVYGPSTWSDELSRFLQNEIALPLDVGDYKLYADSVAANKVTISF